MGLADRITEDLTRAMKERDAFRTGVLRMVKSALKNREIDKRSTLDDAESAQVLKSLVKQRAESIAQFEAGGRLDLAEKELREKAVIESYLPAAATPEEIENAVSAVIHELQASGPKDIGRVMKDVMARLSMTGKLVNGRDVNERVRARLQGA